MKHRLTGATIFLTVSGLSLARASALKAQQAALVGGMVEGVTGGLRNTLVGYALTAIGLNSIATVANTYTNLLQAGESTSATVSPANINNFLTQVVMGPGGDLPPISSALVAINIALQSTDNDGIIGSCERAVSTVPATGSFGADATFYADPINLLQYFADYQTVATLLLVEYYNYEAFFSSPYYSATQPLTFTSATTGQSSATFYYDDGDQGTPQITADPGTMVPGIQDEIISSDTPAPEEVSATAKHTGTSRMNGKIEIKGQMVLPSGTQLQRATLAFNKVLSKDAGNGELVRQGSGMPLNLPVVLAILRDSKPQGSTYLTQGNGFPRVQVEIKALKRNPGLAKFRIEIGGAEISSPRACTGNPSSTMLHTRMIANDGTHPSAVLDLNLNYRCHRSGNLNTLASATP